MKLTPDNIAAIEAVLTDIEDGMGNRGVIIKYGISDIIRLSAFLSVCRGLGIGIDRGRMSRLSGADRKAFIEFLRQKREARAE